MVERCWWVGCMSRGTYVRMLSKTFIRFLISQRNIAIEWSWGLTFDNLDGSECGVEVELVKSRNVVLELILDGEKHKQ